MILRTRTTLAVLGITLAGILVACSSDNSGSSSQGNGSSTQPVPSDEAPPAGNSNQTTGATGKPKLPPAPILSPEGCQNPRGDTCQTLCCNGTSENPDGADGCPDWLEAKPNRCEPGIRPRNP